MRSTVRVASVALAATLFVAACGSDSSDSDAGTDAGTLPAAVDTTPETTVEVTDTTTATPAPQEPARDLEADTAAAEAALITVADLPAGWTEAPRDAEAESTLESRLTECVGTEAEGVSSEGDATAASALLVAPTGNLDVAEDITVQADEREARLFVALFAEPAVPTCVETVYGELAAEAFAGVVAEGAEFGTPAATRLQVGSAGDATQAIRVVVPVTGDPAVTAVTVDHVVVRSGRAIASLTFENRTEATAVETIDEFTVLAAAGLVPA
jgi:hypothetical protein